MTLFLLFFLFFCNPSYSLEKEISQLDPLNWFSDFSTEIQKLPVSKQENFLKTELPLLANHLKELVQDIAPSEFDLLERDFYSQGWIQTRLKDQESLSVDDKKLYVSIESIIKIAINKERQKRIDLALLEPFFEKKSKNKVFPVISADGLEDLDIVHSNKKKKSISKILSPTKTYFGALRKEDMISYPITDSTLILSRQASIKAITDNQQTRIVLKNNLEKIGSHTSCLLSYFNKQNPVHTSLEKFYFASSYTQHLNKQPLALEASKVLGTGSNLLYLGALIGFEPIKQYAQYYALNWRAKTVAEGRGSDYFSDTTTTSWGQVFTSSFLGPIKRCVNNLNPVPNCFSGKLTYEKRDTVYHNHTARLNMTQGDTIKEQSFLFFHDNQHILKYAVPAGLALLTYATLYTSYKQWGTNIKDNVAWIVSRNNPIDLIKKDLTSILQVVESLEVLSQELSRHKAFTNNTALAPFTQKEHLYKENYAHIAQLKKLLSSDAIQKTSSWKLSSGEVLVAHKLLQEIKDSFIPFFTALGELDTYLSVAESLVAQNSSDTQFCFVTFSNQSKPLIELDNFWHPLATKTAPVTNTLHLGGTSSPYGIILTGPNNCGKSTSMKAVALNLILAQTFGIAAAEKAHLSIFSRIHTYINNSQDDINNGWGAFKAEKEKVASILASVKELPAEQYSFNILDEAFKGTVGDECEERVFNFGKTLSESSNTLSMFATHGKFPMTLEEYTHGLYQNYQVELIETEPGKFIRTHKLLRSKNNWWFDDKVKRQRFLETV